MHCFPSLTPSEPYRMQKLAQYFGATDQLAYLSSLITNPYYKINLPSKKMFNPSASQKDNEEQVYGFLCQKTNVFYAFESYESYKQFLDWLEQENSLASGCTLPEEPQRCPVTPSEDQRLANFERATDEIMSVFEDPIFEAMEQQIQMQEIDF